ncbi:hypothetical protein GCM10022288_00820 [Gryllotalpicola kribbensis]|uniref:M23ase beta-sheet core domain-containing protein n=1 Tax=Gryllotalpicola kribbensis TaxID=993084 RepID=A0ABP8AEJ9_9MICO
MHETPAQPQTRRALRELERAQVPRRRRVRGHASAAAESAGSRRPAPVDPIAPVVASLPGAGAAPIAAPVPAAAVAQNPSRGGVGRKRRTSRPLTVAAFLFAVGLAVTSVVPMLALGQSATAAAASATGVQGHEQLQAWQAAMTSTRPAAPHDQYSTNLVKPGDPLTGNGKIEWPFPFNSPISYGYGPRVAPMEGASTFHKGVDFDPGAGVAIQNITAGTVTKVVTNPHSALGIEVVVDHGTIDGHHIESLYCEMAPGSIKVAVGQKIAMGTIVGNVGVSGISTGAHLHFELHQDGEAVDPLAWLRAHAG